MQDRRAGCHLLQDAALVGGAALLGLGARHRLAVVRAPGPGQPRQVGLNTTSYLYCLKLKADIFSSIITFFM